jgi:hypothetical protein
MEAPYPRRHSIAQPGRQEFAGRFEDGIGCARHQMRVHVLYVSQRSEMNTTGFRSADAASPQPGKVGFWTMAALFIVLAP